MKKRRTPFNIFLFSLVILSVAAFITIIILAIIFRSEDAWKNVLFDLVCGLISALIITGGLGFLFDLCRHQYITAMVDIKQLRDMGIKEVGTGKSTPKDERRMFGTSRSHNYPYCLKLMFFTGQNFFVEYHRQLTKCLNEGCHIQILLADPHSTEYLTNIEQLRCRLDLMSDDINNKSLQCLKKIWEDAGPLCKGSLTVRFYRTEYLNGLRIAKYALSEERDLSYYWINVQSPKQCATELSVSLKGIIDEEVSVPKENPCKKYEDGFDDLWEKYKATEQHFSHP